MDTKQIFGKRTSELRKERGLSQAELAAELDISRTSVNLYESASRAPDITVLARYASFFSVTSDYLLGLSDNRTSENAAVGDKLGLSDKSIERLQALTEKANEAVPSKGLVMSLKKVYVDSAKGQLFAVNELISSPQILQLVESFLTNSLDELFIDYYDYDNEHGLSDDEISQNAEINELVTMYRLQKELIKLRDKINNTGDDTTNDKKD